MKMHNTPIMKQKVNKLTNDSYIYTESNHSPFSLFTDDAESDLDKAKRAADFLSEPSEWKRFVNINAVFILTITCFLWGFYA